MYFFHQNIFNGSHSWLISIGIEFAIVTNKNHQLAPEILMIQLLNSPGFVSHGLKKGEKLLQKLSEFGWKFEGNQALV